MLNSLTLTVPSTTKLATISHRKRHALRTACTTSPSGEGTLSFPALLQAGQHSRGAVSKARTRQCSPLGLRPAEGAGKETRSHFSPLLTFPGGSPSLCGAPPAPRAPAGPAHPQSPFRSGGRGGAGNPGSATAPCSYSPPRSAGGGNGTACDPNRSPSPRSRPGRSTAAWPCRHRGRRAEEEEEEKEEGSGAVGIYNRPAQVQICIAHFNLYPEEKSTYETSRRLGCKLVHFNAILLEIMQTLI